MYLGVVTFSYKSYSSLFYHDEPLKEEGGLLASPAPIMHFGCREFYGTGVIHKPL